MQLHYKDRAIEYNAMCTKIKNKIRALQKIKIDVSAEEKHFQEIMKRCNGQARSYKPSFASSSATQDTASIEAIYDRHISELNEIEEQLKRHDLYLDAYDQAVNLENRSREVALEDDEQKSNYSSTIIHLLEMINLSDTRPFHEEQVVVSKIYEVAYEIIKMEILQSGKSKTLMWFRENEVASNSLVELVEKELEKVKSSGESGLLNDMLKEINSYVRPNLFNEELILFLALQNGANKERVEAALAHIVKGLMNEESIRDKIIKDIEDIRERLVEIKERLQKSHAYKRIGVMLGLVGILLGIKFGADKHISKIGHMEYRTYPEYYTNVEGEPSPNFPEYMEGVEGFESVELTAYGPWRRRNIFFGDYQRSIATYNLTHLNIGDLSDALELNFEEIICDTQIETREELDPSELYTDAIIEILRLTQDESDNRFVPHEENQAVISIIVTVVLCVIGVVGEGLSLLSLISKLKEKFSDQKFYAENKQELLSLLENYKVLCERNEEFRTRFTDMYARVSKYYKSEMMYISNNKFKKIKFTPLDTLQKYCDID